MSSDPNMVVISSIDSKGERVTVWEMGDNQELTSIEMSKPYVVIFDLSGKPYIVSSNTVHFADMNCTTTAFEFDNVDLQDLIKQDQQFGKTRTRFTT